jgi:hypothetical protein
MGEFKKARNEFDQEIQRASVIDDKKDKDNNIG